MHVRRDPFPDDMPCCWQTAACSQPVAYATEGTSKTPLCRTPNAHLSGPPALLLESLASSHARTLLLPLHGQGCDPRPAMLPLLLPRTLVVRRRQRGRRRRSSSSLAPVPLGHPRRQLQILWLPGVGLVVVACSSEGRGFLHPASQDRACWRRGSQRSAAARGAGPALVTRTHACAQASNQASMHACMHVISLAGAAQRSRWEAMAAAPLTPHGVELWACGRAPAGQLPRLRPWLAR